MAERIELRTSFLGVPIKREVIKGRRVVQADTERLRYSISEYKTVVDGQTGRVVTEHYSDQTISSIGLCHISEIDADQVRLKSRLPGVKRTLVRR